MSLKQFHNEDLGKYLEKGKNYRKERKRFILACLSIIPLLIISYFLSEILNPIYQDAGIGLICISMLIWTVIYLKYESKKNKLNFTGKERIIWILYKGIEGLANYIEKKKEKDFNECLKYLKKTINFNEITVGNIDTKIALETKQFLNDIYKYFQIEIIPPLSLGASKEKLISIKSKLEVVFDAIYKEKYSEPSIKKISKEYTEKEKESLFKKLKTNYVKPFKRIKAILFIAFLFFLYWFVNIYIINRNFHINEASLFALTVPGALYYSTKWFGESKDT